MSRFYTRLHSAYCTDAANNIIAPYNSITVYNSLLITATVLHAPGSLPCYFASFALYNTLIIYLPRG